MALFFRTERGVAYLKITLQELIDYSDNSAPACDNCLDLLKETEEVVLIPLLNEAFCPKCAKERLAQVVRYPEDAHIERRRELFWRNWFGITEGG